MSMEKVGPGGVGNPYGQRTTVPAARIAEAGTVKPNSPEGIAAATFTPTQVTALQAVVSGYGIPYLGVVATRCGVPTMTNGTQKQTMSRSVHYASRSLSELQIAWAGWRADTALKEPGLGGTMTIRATVEYPVGVFNRVMFGGSDTGTIPDGDNLISDTLTLSTPIPKGAEFFVRAWTTSSTGILYDLRSFGTLGGGEACTYAPSGVADQTGGGTVVNTAAGVIYRPLAILAMTTTPSFMQVGDSRVAGQTDTPTDLYGGCGEFSRLLDPHGIASINSGLGGQGMSGLFSGSHYVKRAALGQWVSGIMCNLGINDLRGGTSAATLLSYYPALRTLFGNSKPIYAATLPPSSTSTDGWVTTANQTTHSSNAQRIIHNNNVRNGVLPVDGFVEIADVMESARDSGLWLPNYTADGVHGNSASGLALQRASWVLPSWMRA